MKWAPALSYDLCITVWSSQADCRSLKSSWSSVVQKHSQLVGAPEMCIESSRANCDPTWAADGGS